MLMMMVVMIMTRMILMVMVVIFHWNSFLIARPLHQRPYHCFAAMYHCRLLHITTNPTQETTEMLKLPILTLHCISCIIVCCISCISCSYILTNGLLGGIGNPSPRRGREREKLEDLEQTHFYPNTSMVKYTQKIKVYGACCARAAYQ